MNVAATQAHAADSPERGPMKFTYASGARPLEGYTIKRGVGQGGFGEVYYAVSDGGKEVALKLVRRNLDIERRGVQQCLNLKHTNLLTVYDIRTDAQGDSWIVMEFVRGECLEEVTATHPQGLPREEALAWFRGLAAAVAYLHDQGIVHRDLKPGNIFRENGVVKLGDYGLSKFISVSRRSGQTESVGTVHYMAPEIAHGRYGKEIDIYALGVVLYELLTGHVPFDGESVGEVLMKHLTALPDVSRLDEPFRSAVAACLAKDPNERPHSVEDMVAAVEGRAALVARAVSPATAQPAPLAELARRAAPPPPPQPAGSRPMNLAAGGSGRSSRHRRLLERAPLHVWIWDVPRLNSGWWTFVIVISCLWFARLGASTGTSYEQPTLFLWLLVIGGVLAWHLASRLLQLNDREQGPTRENPRPAEPSAAMRAAELAARIPRRDPSPALAQPPARWALTVKTRRERLAELLGSMLLAAIISIVCTLMFVVAQRLEPRPELFAWLSVGLTLGAWLVLIPAKLWEGTDGDAVLRRFVMLLAGLALGAMLWLLDSWLMLSLGYEVLHVRGLFDGVRERAFDADGQPLLVAYLSYFGLCYVIVAWWRQADPLREQRFSLGSLAAAVGLAFVIHAMWPFPQPWGLLIVAGVSIVVQLSSPWVSRRDRSRRRLETS